MIEITTEKIVTIIRNEKHKQKSNLLENIINTLFYFKEKSELILETKKTNSGYEHNIIKGDNPYFIGGSEKNFLNALEILGQKALEANPVKNETQSYCETSLYTIDIFGIKRLKRYLLNK